MELRKVQRTNSGTFFVSLPRNWAERVGLHKGDVLAASESFNGRLYLDPQQNTERRPLGVVIKPTQYIDREVVGAYLLGYDEIRVEARNRISSEQRALVKRTSSRLVGLEIVEEDYANITLQCLLEPTASSPGKILRREYKIAAGMHRDAVRAFLESDLNLAENVIARDVEVNRFYFLLVRTLRTVIQDPISGEKLGIRPIDCLDYRLCANLVETIGDRAVEIAYKAVALKRVKIPANVSKEVWKFHTKVLAAQENAMEAFFRHDVLLAEKVRDERAEMDSLFHKVELAVKNEAAGVVPMILTTSSSLYRIFGHSVDIADLVMPREPLRSRIPT